MQNNRAVGARYEQLAEKHLVKNGLRIADRNFRIRRGEIDLIAYDGNAVVFVEVKYRKTKNAGAGADAVDYKKQYRICRIADYYRMLHGMGESCAVRFDVVSIDADVRGELRLNWYKNAFPYLPASHRK